MKILFFFLALILSHCNFLSSEKETKESSPLPLILPKSIPNYLQNFSFFLPEIITEIATYTKQKKQNLGLYNIEVHRLYYSVPDINGKSTIASALLLVPQKKASDIPAPLSIVSHSTIFAEQEAPTVRMDSMLIQLFGSLEGGRGKNSEEIFQNSRSKIRIATHLLTIEGAIDAYRGFITIIPDYLGYGSSAKNIQIQPYLISKYYPIDAIEALQAAKTVLDSLDILFTNKIFLRGYSEGGYATLVIQEKLESLRESIAASAPSGGPYYLPLTIRSQVNKNTISLSAVIPKLFTSYREYEKISLDNQKIYTAKAQSLKLDTLIIHKKESGRSISTQMGDSIKNILSPETITRIRTDSIQDSYLQAFFEKLETNTPAAAKGEYQLSSPTRLYTCDKDPLITPKNADSLGAILNIPVIKLAGSNHSNCRAYSAPLIWFDSILNEM